MLFTIGQTDQLNRMKTSTVKTKQDSKICKNSKILKYRSGTVNSNMVNSKFHQFEVNLTGI